MKKGKFMLFGLAVLAAGAVGGTWAAWTTAVQTGNEYMIPQYRTSLEEKFNPPDDWQPGITTEKQVWVSNNVKDADGKSGVPAIAKVVLHQSWIRNQNIYKKDEAGQDVLVAEKGEIPPFTFSGDGKEQYAAIPNFSREHVCVLRSGQAQVESFRLGLPYVDTVKEAEGKWLLVSEEPEEAGNFKLYYIGVLEPGEDSPVFLESVTMNPLLEATLTDKKTTYEKQADGTYKQVTVTNVNSKYGYDGCRYTLDIKATTVQATKAAVEQVFGQGNYEKEIVRHLAENVADDGIYDHSDLAKTLTLVQEGGNRLAYVPYRTQDGAEDGNWFMSFTDMLPGGTYLDRLNVENITRSISARIYMRIKPRNQEPIKDELLELISMRVVYKEDGQEDLLIYEGTASGVAFGDNEGLRELVPLCYLRPGNKGTVEVTMSLDPSIELDPETGKCIYADQLSKIDWEFVAQGVKPGGNGGSPGGGGPGGGGTTPGRSTVNIGDPDVPLANVMIPDEDVPLGLLPRMGDTRMTKYYLAIAAVSMALFIILGLCWKKEKNA